MPRTPLALPAFSPSCYHAAVSRAEDRDLPPAAHHPRVGHAFLDTVDPEAGTDQLASPRELADWLVERRLLDPEIEVTEADFRRAISFRDGLRAWREAGGKVDREIIASLNWSASMTLVRPRITRRLNLRIEPASEGFDGALGHLLGMLLADPRMGLWPLSDDGQGAPDLQRTRGGSTNLSRRWPSPVVRPALRRVAHLAHHRPAAPAAARQPALTVPRVPAPVRKQLEVRFRRPRIP